RIEAMLAKARQVHHEGVFELAVNVLLDRLEIVVLRALVELAAQDFLPVRAPFYFVHRPPTDERQRPRHRGSRQFPRDVEGFVIAGEGVVVIVDLGQVRIGKDVRQVRPAPALLGDDLAALLALPAAAPTLLILPILRVSDARLGLDVVEPRIFHALTRGPDVLARHGAGVAPDAFVEVEHHRDLTAYLHDTASSIASSTGL